MEIEVRRKGGRLVFIVGGRTIQVGDYLRAKPPYMVLKVLATQSNGRLVLNSAYELAHTLARYISAKSAVGFVNEVLPDVPEDLRKTNALLSASSAYPLESASFTVIPRSVQNEVSTIRQLLNTRGYSIDDEEIAELFRLSEDDDERVIRRTVPIPTAIGFAYTDASLVALDTSDEDDSNKYVFVRAMMKGTDFGREFYVHDMALGDLMVLVNLINASGRDNGSPIVKLAKNAPQAPSGLINQYLARDADIVKNETTLNTVLLHQLLGDLKGVEITAPVIEPNGVSWEKAKIRRVSIDEKSVRLIYGQGSYVGWVKFVPGTNNKVYAEAMEEFMERNPWLKQRMEENTKVVTEFLRKYIDYITEFKNYADMLFK